MARVEICVDSVEGAVAAERGGADRVELCANLLEGGTTPSAGCITLVRQRIHIGLQVLVRPRGGDFLYGGAERAVMEEDIRAAKALGADGIVIGCLTSAGEIDGPRLREWVALARPLAVTFHRAFDMCRDPGRALEELIALGVARVLTSGQEATCREGIGLITELNRQAAGRMIVMAGGGITPANVRQIVAGAAIPEVHLSARTTVESAMEYRNARCCLGGDSGRSEFSWKATDERIVRAVVEALRPGQ